MSFYHSLAPYYEQVFPLDPDTLTFIRTAITGHEQSVLDIGCATGELARALAPGCGTVTGIDADALMISVGSQKTVPDNLSLRVSDMLNLDTIFNPVSLTPGGAARGPAGFSAVLCLGNTLVHLSSAALIERFLAGVRRVLQPGGVFICQILNYDRILAGRITSLPLIENADIRFERSYRYPAGSPCLGFVTSLTDKRTGQRFDNEVPLLPLQAADLQELLVNAGVPPTGTYGEFTGEPFDRDSFALITVSNAAI